MLKIYLRQAKIQNIEYFMNRKLGKMVKFDHKVLLQNIEKKYDLPDLIGYKNLFS